jgi:Putative zinc-finger
VNRTRILTCGEARELIPDLALGTLSGDDRALVLDHLGTCNSCGTEAVDLAAVIDDLLKLAPHIDPPGGFESKVLARMAAADAVAQRRSAWRRPRVLIGSAAAAVVVVGALSGAIIATRGRTSGLDEQYVQTIRALGGQELRAAPLSAGGAPWGQAFVYRGKSSWVFVSMSWDVPDGDYHIVLDRSDGPSATVARIRLVRGQGSVGMTVGDTRTVTLVRVVDPAGQTVCTAKLPTDT